MECSTDNRVVPCSNHGGLTFPFLMAPDGAVTSISCRFSVWICMRPLNTKVSIHSEWFMPRD